MMVVMSSDSGLQDWEWINKDTTVAIYAACTDVDSILLPRYDYKQMSMKDFNALIKKGYICPPPYFKDMPEWRGGMQNNGARDAYTFEKKFITLAKKKLAKIECVFVPVGEIAPLIFIDVNEKKAIIAPKLVENVDCPQYGEYQTLQGQKRIETRGINVISGIEYLNKKELATVKDILKGNERQKFNDTIKGLLEKGYIYEFRSGNYRVIG